MESLYALLIVYIVLELFETQWQKADSLMGMLLRMHTHYQKSIVWFLILHPTFYFTIWLVIVTDFNASAAIMLFIKTVDIATKILLIQQVFEKRKLSQEMSMMLLTPLNRILPYIGLVIYPPLVFFSFI